MQNREEFLIVTAMATAVKLVKINVQVVKAPAKEDVTRLVVDIATLVVIKAVKEVRDLLDSFLRQSFMKKT